MERAIATREMNAAHKMKLKKKQRQPKSGWFTIEWHPHWKYPAWDSRRSSLVDSNFLGASIVVARRRYNGIIHLDRHASETPTMSVVKTQTVSVAFFFQFFFAFSLLLVPFLVIVVLYFFFHYSGNGTDENNGSIKNRTQQPFGAGKTQRKSKIDRNI